MLQGQIPLCSPPPENTIAGQFALSSAGQNGGYQDLVFFDRREDPYFGVQLPGETASTTFILNVDPNQNRFFSYAGMIFPTNDGFIGNDTPQAIELFDAAGNFVGADFIVYGRDVWDAGTEVNDEAPTNVPYDLENLFNSIDENGVVSRHPGLNPAGTGGIVDFEFNGERVAENADFSAPGYQIARIRIQASEKKNMFIDSSQLLEGFVHDSNLPIPLRGEGLSGAAWLDYDNDADLDLFLPNGKAGVSALFRNNGDGTFTDVAEQAGVANPLGNSGVVVGDIDNNGFPDIFMTGEGRLLFAEQSPTVLYLNQGDGTFQDISDIANIPGANTAMGAAMADINNDGYLDIFIASPGHLDVAPAFGQLPGAFGGVAEQDENKLYLNNGPNADGLITFTDISVTAGVNGALGGCVSAFTDYNNDGFMDIIVGNCNDVDFNPTPFHLYRNNGDLTFTDVAEEAGLAVNGLWMAIAPGDYDNDGDQDFFATNFGVAVDAPHAFFQNNGDGTYTNIAAELGLADWEFGWGATLTDFDNDGFLDLYFAGAFPLAGEIGPGRGNPGRLFFNDGEGGFIQADQAETGGDLSSRYTSGVAQGDFNSDGFADLIVMTTTQLAPQSGEVIDLGTPLLLENTANDNNWLTVRLEGTQSNRSAIGAVVRVTTTDSTQIREVRAGSSFASSESPWPSFGLGDNTEAQVTIEWPSGEVQTLSVQANQLITVTEEPTVPVPKNVFGTSDADYLDTEVPDEKQFVGDGQNLFTGSGDDTVDVTFAPGGNRIDLGSGDDIVFAGTDNRIIAGSGDDTLFVDSAGGNNVITGGADADQFWIVTDTGALPTEANTITDFTIDEDVIGFGNTDLNFDALNLIQDGSSTIINALGQDLAILGNTQASGLNASDFVFA